MARRTGFRFILTSFYSLPFFLSSVSLAKELKSSNPYIMLFESISGSQASHLASSSPMQDLNSKRGCTADCGDGDGDGTADGGDGTDGTGDGDGDGSCQDDCVASASPDANATRAVSVSVSVSPSVSEFSQTPSASQCSSTPAASSSAKAPHHSSVGTQLKALWLQFIF